MDYASDKHWKNAGIDRICHIQDLTVVCSYMKPPV